MSLPKQRYYNEPEAAGLLCISLNDLHEILDNHVFSNENPRPENMEFTYSELLLLSVWAKPTRECNVIEMPARK